MRTLILVATLVVTFAVIVSSQTPPPLLAAPTKSNYQPLKERIRSQCSISNRGISSVNAIGTPLGRYQKLLYNAIGLSWYAYMAQSGDLVSIGAVRITFWVDRNGQVKPGSLKVRENTSSEAFANVCLQSILKAPLPSTPEEVAATLPPEGLEQEINFINFPNGPPGTTARAKLEHAILTVSENDEIKLDGKKIAVDDLADAFRHLSAIQRACLVLQADKKASSGIIVKVMDALKLSGVKRSADIHSGDQK
jgi:biopolymer transport protein ExbD